MLIDGTCFHIRVRQYAVAIHVQRLLIKTMTTLVRCAFEYVEDADAVAKYGVNNKDIKAVGCYSQGQANRLGKWTLLK